MSNHSTRCAAAAALVIACLGTPLCADTGTAPLEQVLAPMQLDTGAVRTAGTERGVAYSGVIAMPGRPWVRLEFDLAQLGRTPRGGQPTELRITNLLDGGVQLLNGRTLQEWGNTSAYFNGGALRIEIIADPAAAPSRLVMSHIIAGTGHVMDEGSVATICFGTDDRVLSSEPGNGRQLPIGCTVWLINDPQRTFITAGHCDPGETSVIEFNVPLSSPSGTLMHPPPQDQYAVDPSSPQLSSLGIGEDWCYFGCFPNSNTGLTPYAAQGACYTLAHEAPALADPAQSIRVTGYGTVAPPVDPQFHQVQRTHAGPYVGLSGNIILYQVDTTGGNSGSPVVDVATGLAIGIHTEGACTETGGANEGTAIQHAGLQNALAHPQGVCVPNPGLQFSFPDGVPAVLSPAGDSVRVEVLPGNGEIPVPGTGVLQLDTGAGFAPVPMSEVSPNVYDAVFPATACQTHIRFFVQAQSDLARTSTAPITAPNTFFAVLSATGVDTPLDDNFQTDLGWTVANSAGLTTGAWQRAVPTAAGARVPHADADGSGACYVTDNTTTNDVDGGSTTLTSPMFDATAPNATLSYWRWFSTSSSDTIDALRVEVSADDGAHWALLEEYSNMGIGWTRMQWAVADMAGVTPSTQFRVRFTASDLGTASSVEAAIDGVLVRGTECAPPCPADLNSDGTVDGADLGALLGNWGNADTGDLNDDGAVDGADLGQLLGAWGACGG